MPLFNPSFTGVNIEECLTGFLYQHILSDWNLVKLMWSKSVDEVSLLMHCILLSCTGSDGDILTDAGVTLGTSASASMVLTRLSTAAERAAWEEMVVTKHLIKYIDKDLPSLIAAADKKFGGDSSGENVSVFESELLEQYDVNSLSLAKRQEGPGLWLYSRRFDVTHFITSLNMNSIQKRHPVLFHFVAGQENKEKSIKSLRYLTHVLEWVRYLKTKYSGHLDRETARLKTVAHVLEEAEEGEKSRIMKSFEGFSAAWNEEWRNVDTFGCLEIPVLYKQLSMTLTTPISYSLPNNLDEGVCPLALVGFMIQKHNAVVELVDEAVLLRMQNFQRESALLHTISYRFLTEAHTINVSFENDFVPFLEKQCVMDNGRGYDFAKAEDMLIRRYLSRARMIDVEFPGFNYAHEESENISRIREYLKQTPMPSDVLDAIKREITTPAHGQMLLDLLETLIAILGSSLGSATSDLSLGETLLSTYLRDVLMNHEDLNSRAVAQKVQLKHIDSFYSLLLDVTVLDAFSSTEAKFKMSLSEESIIELDEALSHEDFDKEVIVLCMKKLIRDQLGIDACIKVTEGVKTVLGYIEHDDQNLMDLHWFTHFPESVTMSEIVEAYKYVKNKL